MRFFRGYLKESWDRDDNDDDDDDEWPSFIVIAVELQMFFLLCLELPAEASSTNLATSFNLIQEAATAFNLSRGNGGIVAFCSGKKCV